MGATQFVKDRLGFLGLVACYTAWKETAGRGHWETMVATFGDFELVVVGTLLTALLAYSVVGGFFAVLDLVLAPGATPGVRLQPMKAHSWDQYRQALPLVVFNLVVVALPANLAMYYFLHPASPYSTARPSGMYHTLPSTFVLLRDILVSMVLREMVFYYLHRLFHHPALYATFHKEHHEFTAPVAVAGNLSQPPLTLALYVHPVDFVVTNVFPLLVGPLLLNSHPVTVWLYLVEAIIEAVATHSGYSLPCFPKADMHDFHHETFTSNFGLLGLADYLHGTHIKFKHRLANKEILSPSAVRGSLDLPTSRERSK